MGNDWSVVLQELPSEMKSSFRLTNYK